MIEERRVYKIPVNNISIADAKKVIEKILIDYNTDDYSWIREYDRKELLENRKLKLNELWMKNSQ